MAFIKYSPLGEKITNDINTTTSKEIQLWQELSMLRHISGPNAIYARETIAPWIDQAKMYFLDACNCNWKSAGLLYYYSFLNLAKAHIVTNRAVSGKTLKSTSIYHGLVAQPQKPRRIVDFKIDIHSPVSKGKKNIFSQFYEKLTNEKWPFRNSVTIEISEVISYCDEISHELMQFYGIEKKMINLVSTIRDDDLSNVWLELLVPDSKLNLLQAEIGNHISKITNFASLTNEDKIFWRDAQGKVPLQLLNHSLVRVNQISYTEDNRDDVYDELIKNTVDHFKGSCLPMPIQDFNTDNYWNYVPKVEINGISLTWHPLLSNYLFAFVLSTILRYHPYLFHGQSKDAFIAEAWCNQSATTTIRYFLMDMSNLNLRIN